MNFFASASEGGPVFYKVATLVLRAQQITKRSHDDDEASKHAVASSKLKPVGKRVLALTAVRRPMWIPAQDTTQSDVKRQVIPSQTSDDPLRFSGVQASRDRSHKVSNIR